MIKNQNYYCYYCDLVRKYVKSQKIKFAKHLYSKFCKKRDIYIFHKIYTFFQIDGYQ